MNVSEPDGFSFLAQKNYNDTRKKRTFVPKFEKRSKIL